MRIVLMLHESRQQENDQKSGEGFRRSKLQTRMTIL